MSFSDLFDSEFKQRNKGHFSAIVRVALTDERFSQKKKHFQTNQRYDQKFLHQNMKKFQRTLLKYPINAPYLHEQRLERLYDLARMVYVDHHLGDKQELLLRKIGVGLGFNAENVNYIVDKALKLVDKKVDLDTFVFECKNMNK